MSPEHPRGDLPSSHSVASPTSPEAARAGTRGGGRVPGGSGADPHGAGLLLLADQAPARSPKCARATRGARGPGR